MLILMGWRDGPVGKSEDLSSKSSTFVKSMAVYAFNPSFAGFRQAEPQSLLASQPT